MSSQISFDISNTWNHKWRGYGLAALLSGLALISVLIFSGVAKAQPGQSSQSNKTVHTAIVTCGCNSDGVCTPKNVDSSIVLPETVEEFCDTGTCAQCLAGVARVFNQTDQRSSTTLNILSTEDWLHVTTFYSPWAGER